MTCLYASMLDAEIVEFAGGRALVAFLVADEVEKAFPDFTEEGIGFAANTLGDELDATVGQIADVARYFVAMCDFEGRVSEANALHVTGVMYGAAMGRAGQHEPMTFGSSLVDGIHRVYLPDTSAASLDRY